MGTMASQITSVSIVCASVCSGADQRQHQSSTSLAFVRGIHRWPMDFPHKGPVTRKMLSFEDVIMKGLLKQRKTAKIVNLGIVIVSILNWRYWFQSYSVVLTSALLIRNVFTELLGVFLTNFIGHLGTHFTEIITKISTFLVEKFIWKYRRQTGCHFIQGSMY